MKLFETFREFRVFVFRYRATNENAELEENKIRVIFDWENLWKGIRVSLGMILRLFYQQRKEIIIFRGFRRFREFRGIDLAQKMFLVDFVRETLGFFKAFTHHLNLPFASNIIDHFSQIARRTFREENCYIQLLRYLAVPVRSWWQQPLVNP